MESKWPILTVKELVDKGILEKPLDGNHGSTHPRGDDFVKNGVPFIMASDLKNGRVDIENCSYIRKEQADCLRKGFSVTGDVLISHKATIGRTAVVGEINNPYIMLTPQVTYYRVKDKAKLNNRYLKYYFDSKPFQNLFMSWAGGGSTRAYLGITAQQKLPICLPPIDEQKRISSILGSIDDKIELNRKMNQTLESLAQAMFKSWFVDFDPVIDNALAAKKPIPDELKAKAEIRQQLGDNRKPLPKEIQKLFPNEFVQTDVMGWIPKGWGVSSIAEIADNPRRSIQPINIESKTPYIGLQDMPQKCIALDSWANSEGVTSGKYCFKQGEFLFGKLRPYFHKVGVAPVNGVCSTDILVVQPKTEEVYSLVLGHLISKEFIEYVTGSSTGTRMPRTNWDDMKKYNITFPPLNLASYLSSCFKSSVDRIQSNIRENQALSNLRDLLLPKLISGELTL